MQTNDMGRLASPLTEGLGPLPAPAVHWPENLLLADGGQVLAATYYTSAEMRAYAAQERAAERERCAKLCDEVSREHFSEGMTWESNGAAACAARLRRA